MILILIDIPSSLKKKKKSQTEISPVFSYKWETPKGYVEHKKLHTKVFYWVTK